MKTLRRLNAAWGSLALVLTAPFALAAPVAYAVEDIRDIRAPVPFPAWMHWPLLIAGAAIAAFAVILLLRWWQRHRARALTPLERARQALLVAETHARAGQAHQWADVVAETLRSALAARLGADVLPQTTSELAKSTLAVPSPGSPAHEAQFLPEAPALLEVLGACVLARFALASLDAEALLSRTGTARDLVEKLLAPPPKQRAAPSSATPVMS